MLPFLKELLTLFTAQSFYDCDALVINSSGPPGKAQVFKKS